MAKEENLNYIAKPSKGDCIQDITPGPVARCKACLYGFHKLIEHGARLGYNNNQIKRLIRNEKPYLYKHAQLTGEDITSHIAHDPLRRQTHKIAQKARKDMIRHELDANVMMESVMTAIAKGLQLVEDIPQEKIEELSTKERFDIANKASNTMIKTIETSMKAKKMHMEEQEWLKEINAAAAESSHNLLKQNEEEK